MTTEINEINAHNRELKVVGCVNASGTVYPGAKILVRDEIDEIRSECKAVTFYFDNGFVKRKNMSRLKTQMKWKSQTDINKNPA